MAQMEELMGSLSLNASPLAMDKSAEITPSKMVLSTPLKPGKLGPPKRVSFPQSEISPNQSTQSSKENQKQPVNQKKNWDNSIQKDTPQRSPWSAELRMRKASNVAPSPRTPHISQINIKKQKNTSQLTRTFAKISPKVEFKEPALPLKSAASTNKDDLEEQIKELRMKLANEIRERKEIEKQYKKESNLKMKIEVEMQFLEKRAIEAENSLTELKKNVVFIQRESVKNEQLFEEKLRKEVEKRKVIEKELRQLKAKISTEKV